MPEQDWKTIAQQKRDALNSLIPREWRIPEIPPVEKQRDVTGPYIQQFLSQKEVEITETDAVGIVQKTTTGRWTALEVARAFCHRAALAHQLVGVYHTFIKKLVMPAVLISGAPGRTASSTSNSGLNAVSADIERLIPIYSIIKISSIMLC